SGVRPGQNLEIVPTVTTVRAEARVDGPDDRSDVRSDSDVGLSVKWGVTPNITLNATVNPDFSQVEADSVQLDVNNQFALFFNETRPFFLEGADLFQTPFTIVYTRSVSQPDWGVKLPGKEGKQGGGAFFTQAARTDLVIPGAQF